MWMLFFNLKILASFSCLWNGIKGTSWDMSPTGKRVVATIIEERVFCRKGERKEVSIVMTPI
jgi:hypothetical protein